MTIDHDRLTFERLIACSRPALWYSLIDAEARTTWGPSEGEVLRFTETDTREGGREVHVCGPKADPSAVVTTYWHRILEPDTACFTEVMHDAGRLISASQIDYLLADTEAGSRLQVTVWVSSFVGAGLFDAFKVGWGAALDNLARHLEANS